MKCTNLCKIYPFPHNVHHIHSDWLVAHNCIPGNEDELLICMCVLVLTRGDGTPFGATSIQEKDIIELCIQLDQTHTQDVLQYSVVELVILFHSTDEMLVMVHGVIRATALCKEPITLRMSPPSATHVRAFIVVWDGEPSGTQPPTPDREEEPQPSPNDPHPGGRTPHQFQANFRDAKLRQLMGDLCWEVALRELNMPPGTNCWPPGEIQWEMGTQCGWQGGHLSERGRLGTQRTTTLTPCPHSTRWRCRMSYKYTGHWIATWYLSYCAITKGGSRIYGQVHGPYHQCGPYPTKING